MQGYGQTVIIDHGDHYYTVYGHISRVKAKIGDTLKAGEVFAEAGPASRRMSEGMYFEIRHFSEPENPAHWIAAKQFQISPSNSDGRDRADMARAAYDSQEETPQ
jgi:septal ring factor EnvC (AmiA/AmiB activator)